jgi:hypothetical protein
MLLVLALWQGLLGALIGASASLLGVVLSQRAERRRAHTDRVWTARSREYEHLMRFVLDIRHWTISAGEPAADGRRYSEPPPVYGSDPEVNDGGYQPRAYVTGLLMYASPPVYDAAKAAFTATDLCVPRPEYDSVVPYSYIGNLNTRLDALEAAIRDELRADL